MKQKILILVTTEKNLRDKVLSWDAEDGDMIDLDKEIGLSGSPSGSTFQYKTVMHAVASGWRLIGPPKRANKTEWHDAWEWWLEK